MRARAAGGQERRKGGADRGCGRASASLEVPREIAGGPAVASTRSAVVPRPVCGTKYSSVSYKHMLSVIHRESEREMTHNSMYCIPYTIYGIT